jgi:signal transduction histidine kinase
VMDRDGTILARYPQTETWKRTTASDVAIQRAAQTRLEGTVEVLGPEGVTHLHAFKTLEATPEGDLHVAISIPAQVAFAEVAGTLTRSLASLGLVAALAFAGAWLGGSVFILRPVKALLGVTQQLRAGELRARTGPNYGVGEFGQLARAFDGMAADLEQNADQLRLLLSKSIHIQDEERARIAREMHDGVLQLITAARYELRAAKLAVESGSPLTAEERFSDTREVLDEVEREIRKAIYDLHPSILDGRGLIPALRRYARGFRRVSGLPCEVRVKGAPAQLPSATELGIYRMVEEALQNAAAHGQAQTASVTLDFRPTSLCVTVHDDGKGFDCEQVMASHNADHLGLISIRERSESFGGRMDVRSQTGQGTTVTFWLPIPASGLATT